MLAHMIGKREGRINVIGALLAGTLLSIGLTEANVDADIFNLCLTGDLVPKLPPASVLIMDPATFHRRADTRAAIADAGPHPGVPSRLQPRSQ